MQLQSNGFVQFGQARKVGEQPKIVLELAEEALHESVLPGAGLRARREGYLQLFAQQLVFGA